MQSPPRIQPPRKVVQDDKLRRETCRPGFPTNQFVGKILGPQTDKFGYVADQSFAVSGDFSYVGGTAHSLLREPGKQRFNELKAKNIPILGLIFLEVKSGEFHVIAYLLRNTRAFGTKVWFFETYDTSKVFFKGSDKWAEDLTKIMEADICERAVPSDVDIQEFDEEGKGRCVMWSLIFLYYLKNMDLVKSKREDFMKMYDDILKQNEKSSGFLKLQSIVYGASRKTLKRKHRKVKTRRHGSSLRASRTYTIRTH